VYGTVSVTQLSPRKRAILLAAIDCFNHYGVAGTSIEMIRERTGASVGSLYHHFGSKEKLAVEAYRLGLEDYGNHMQSALRETDSAEAAVASLVHSYLTWIADHPEWARFIFHSRPAVMENDRTGAVNAGTRQRLQQVFQQLQPFLDSGAIRPLPQHCYSSLIIGPAHYYARQWLNGRVQGELRAHIPLFADAAWRAVKGDP